MDIKSKIAGGVLAMASCAPCTHAQSAETAAIEADRQDLMEVVVTARKREERLQDVPLTITAVTSDAITAAGIRDIKHLSTMTPGFHFDNAGSRQNSQPRMRGMDINTANPTRQNASFFIDGIYMPGSTQTLDFSEFERVEVIKGPQSALFGRQTFGGAVNFVSKEPSNDPSMDAVASVGSNGLREYSASLAGPLVEDRLFGRIHVRSYDYSGKYRNSVNGDRLGEQQSRSGSAMIAWKPTESLHLDLRYMKQEDDDGAAPLVQLGASQLNCGPFAAGGFRYYCGALPTRATYQLNHVVAANLHGIDRFGYDRDSQMISLRATWQVADHEISLTGSRFEEESRDVADLDITGVPGFGSVNYQDFDDRSLELKIASAGDGPWQYVVGAFWYEGEYAANLYTPNATLSTLAALGSRQPDVADATNRAAFASIGYRFTDHLGASAELRYQKDEVVNIGGQGAARRTLSGTTNAWLPRVIVDYVITDDAMLYGIYSQGNKPKQFNAGIAGRSPAEQAYILSTYGVDVALDEEKLTNYEIGVKSSWLDRTLTVNAALFHMDWDDQVTRRQVFPSATSTTQLDVVANAGSSRVRGLELETRMAVASSLELEGTFAFVDAEFTSFNSVNVQQVFGNPEAAGKESARFPKYQGSLSATYHIDFSSDWSGSLRVDQLYMGRRWTDEVNLAYADAYWRTNLRATLSRGRFSATAYAENLADDDGIESGSRYRDISVPGNQFSFVYGLSEGRKWGLQFRYSL